MASSIGPGVSAGGSEDGDLLFGRRTYEDLYGVWPHRTDNPFRPTERSPEVRRLELVDRAAALGKLDAHHG
jgi:hypothetical protein